MQGECLMTLLQKCVRYEKPITSKCLLEFLLYLVFVCICQISLCSTLSSYSSVLSHSTRIVYLQMSLRKNKPSSNCGNEMQKSHTVT